MMDVNLSVNLSSKEKLMDIFYLLLEGKPCINNEESKEVAGAYINCWVKAKDETTAKDKAMKYILQAEKDMLISLTLLNVLNRLLTVEWERLFILGLSMMRVIYKLGELDEN